MREKQVVLFDLDGTIVDSMAGITRPISTRSPISASRWRIRMRWRALSGRRCTVPLRKSMGSQGAAADGRGKVPRVFCGKRRV